jgi:hypothetical protein
VDMHYLLFVLPPPGLHIECPKSAVKLMLISGEVLGLIVQKAGSKTAFEVNLSSTETAQEYTEYETMVGRMLKRR